MYYNNLNKQTTHLKNLQKFVQHATNIYTIAQTFSTIWNPGNADTYIYMEK